MIRTAARLGLVVLAALGSGAVACASGSGRARAAQLQVALRSAVPPTQGVDLVAGDTVAVVRLDPSASSTLVSTPAGAMLESFRAALNRTTRPATSPVVTLALPESPPAALTNLELEIVVFADLNRDGAWQRGESYAIAWTGGRGGYRLVREASPARWVLVEGGVPPARHSQFSGLVAYIDPVRPAVER